MMRTSILALCAIMSCSWYVWNWDLAFNSDFAMIGLVGRHILQTGEQFIYVPKVNYQGLLVEGNLSALLFLFLGESPRVLHLCAAIIFCLFLISYHFAVKAWFSQRIAFLSTLLMCFSSPLFFGSVLRTQPYYGETFALGCFLFWSLKKYLETRKYLFFYLASFATGFGLYLYSQIIFFIGAIFLSVVGSGPSLHKIWKWLLFPALFLLYPFDQIHSWKIPGATICFSLVGLVGGFSAWNERNKLKKLFSNRLGTMCLGLAFFLLGYSPNLYFRAVSKEQVVSHIRLIQSSEDFWERVVLFFKGFDEFMISGGPRILSLLLCWGLVIVFVFFSQDNRKNSKAASNPFWILGFLVPLGFCLSRDSTDFFALRYSLSWQLVLSLTVAVLIERVLKIQKSLGLALAILFISFRISTHMFLGANFQKREWLAEIRPWTALKPVAEYLEQKGLSWGYGDYWAAYLMNFCTGGRQNIEPLYSNYLPFYEEEVKRKGRLALIMFTNRILPESEFSQDASRVKIRGIVYQVEEEKAFEKWKVWIIRTI